VTRFKFWVPHAYLRNGRSSEIFLQRETILSLAKRVICHALFIGKNDKSPLKGAWFGSRDPFFVCTAVELETILLATRRAAINNVALDGLLYIALRALEATHVAR